MDADQAEDLLFLTQRIPYPPIKGEKIRPFRFYDTCRSATGCISAA